jgi:hypothetical protein
VKAMQEELNNFKRNEV